ncbi:hypothetical protein JCM17961_49020 [Endothiovibrio diazotrophicus]
MTSGERRVAQRLKGLLEDDYTVWYDIPVGRQRRYPDFIILHPSRGPFRNCRSPSSMVSVSRFTVV